MWSFIYIFRQLHTLPSALRLPRMMFFFLRFSGIRKERNFSEDNKKIVKKKRNWKRGHIDSDVAHSIKFIAINFNSNLVSLFVLVFLSFIRSFFIHFFPLFPFILLSMKEKKKVESEHEKLFSTMIWEKWTANTISVTHPCS